MVKRRVRYKKLIVCKIYLSMKFHFFPGVQRGVQLLFQRDVAGTTSLHSGRIFDEREKYFNIEPLGQLHPAPGQHVLQ